MRHHHYLYLCFAAISLSVTSCMQPRMYIDPQFRKATYGDIKPLSKKYTLYVVSEWQRNGEHYDKLDRPLKNTVERVLRATGVVVPVDEPSENVLRVTINNVGDKAEAAGKGIATGLTLGAIGNTVADRYEARISLRIGGKEITRNFSHAVHTTIGNASAPTGMTPIQPVEVGPRVVEDVILNFIKELRDESVFIDVKPPAEPRDKISSGPRNHHGAMSLARLERVLDVASFPRASLS